MNSYLEIARKALRQAQLPEPTTADSAYSELARQAIQRIAEVCPPGALKWARKVHPTLTDRIDLETLGHLDTLWGDHAPLAEFQAALDELVRLHRDVGELFANEQKKEEPCRAVAENK